MKKLLLIIFIAAGLLSCKKNAEDNPTQYDWVLETATVTPALTFNNKTSTDYKAVLGEESCMKNYTLTLYESGSYVFSSNGALCDMFVPDLNKQKWTREGDVITLTNNNYIQTLKVVNNTLVESRTFTQNSVTYTVVSIFKPKAK
jgi:hypothetical protein